MHDSIVVGLFQNVLRELEQKKPQLDELVHTAENLKADSNRQQLHGKGERSVSDVGDYRLTHSKTLIFIKLFFF